MKVTTTNRPLAKRDLVPAFAELAAGRRSSFADRLAQSESALAQGLTGGRRVNVIRLYGEDRGAQKEFAGRKDALEPGDGAFQPLFVSGTAPVKEGAFRYTRSGAQEYDGNAVLDAHVLMLPQGSGMVVYRFGRNGKLISHSEGKPHEVVSKDTQIANEAIVVAASKTRRGTGEEVSVDRLGNGRRIDNVLHEIMQKVGESGGQVVGYIAGFFSDVESKPLHAPGSLPAVPMIANGQEMPALIVFSLSQVEVKMSFMGVHNPTNKCGIMGTPYGGHLRAANVAGNGEAYALYRILPPMAPGN